MESRIEFDHQRDAGGYRLVLGAKGKSSAGSIRTVLSEASPLNRIVRVGGTLQICRPLQTSAVLFFPFASIKTPTQLVQFQNEYGPIAPGIDAIADLLEMAADMRTAVEAWQSGKLGSVYRTATKLSRIDVVLQPDSLRQTFCVIYRPKTLIDALRLQFAEAVASGWRIKNCKYEQCGRPFATGRGADRREDAEYCSQDHKIKALNQSRPLRRKK